MPAAAPIEHRLARAWEFLRGQRHGFHTAPPVPARATTPGGRHLLLPIGRLDRPDRAAVGLLIDRHEAEAVAAAMFAVPAERLTEADIDDACAEACNVLSGCVVDLLRPTGRAGAAELDLGLPHALPAEHYRALFLASTRLALYELDAEPDAPSGPDVRLVVFDPVCEPPAGLADPATGLAAAKDT